MGNALITMFTSALWLLFLTHAILGQESPCKNYAVNDCNQDENAEIFAMNTGSQLKCQQHCEIEEECQFYSFHTKPTQNVDCHLFSEPFSVYVGHCDVQMGPLNPSPPAKCMSPDENSCEVEQYENCIISGKYVETGLTSPDAVTCEALCNINQGQGCKYWEWSREKGECNLYDSADKQCNIAFGPSDGAPGDCGVTEPPSSTTTGSTASPGTCDIDCPTEGLAIFPDCDDCNQYYECYNGILTPQRCENCYHFDEEKGYCNQPTQVNCGERPPEDNCEAATKPGDCPYDNGYFKDVHNCERYFICVDGQSTSNSCSNSTFTGYYDYNLEWCNFPEKVNCEERPICTGEPPEYKNCQCQGAEKVPDFSCPSGSGVQVFVDPFNCQHLIICQGGAIVQDAYCDDGMYGNDQTGTCVAGNGSACGGRPICNDRTNSEDCYCAN